MTDCSGGWWDPAWEVRKSGIKAADMEKCGDQGLPEAESRDKEVRFKSVLREP